jgi:hypothetical protein
MKKFVSYFFLAIIVTILSATILKAQSNTPASIILPPADWDVHKHVLFTFVTTKKPGNYPLQPAWVGVEKVTARNGYYANEHEIAEETNRWLHFDRLTVCSGHIVPVAKEDRYICNATNEWSPNFAYRPSLPTDTELLGMRDVASVTNFFGWNPFWGPDKNGSGVGTSFFTLGPYNSIDTLYVFFNKQGGSSNIVSTLVRRGHFRSQ